MMDPGTKLRFAQDDVVVPAEIIRLYDFQEVADRLLDPAGSPILRIVRLPWLARCPVVKSRHRHDGVFGGAADGARNMIAFEHGEVDRRIPVGEQAADQTLLVTDDPAALRIAADDEAAVMRGRVGFLQ